MDPSPHAVAVLALPDAVPFNLAVPLEVFFRARQTGLAYDVTLCGDEAVSGPFGVWRPSSPLSSLSHAQTVVVPGRYTEDAPVTPAVLAALRAAADRKARLLAVCGGAFVLAQAGLLDGLTATTHWHCTAKLEKQFPQVQVDARPLFIDNDQVLTSAGLAAGLDLCLHVIRRDHGAAAARVARVMVTAPHREGGQAQFLPPAVPRADGQLAPLRAWLLEHLHEPVTLTTMAHRAHCSTRTLLRRFQQETGQAPHRWLTDRRINAARERLETTSETLDDIAHHTGLGTAANLRAQLRERTGLSPTAYRRAFAEASPTLPRPANGRH